MNKESKKRKYISEELTNSTKNRAENFKECSITAIINLGIPHVGEQIFSSLDTDELIQFLEVSEPWKILIENVLFKRWKGRILEACTDGKTHVVKILLSNQQWRKT